MPDVLLVAERSRPAPAQSPAWLDDARDDPFRWLVQSRAMGAFRGSRAGVHRGKLASVGLCRDVATTVTEPQYIGVDGLNLLPPADGPGEWDVELAERVADELTVRLWCAHQSHEVECAQDKLDWGRATWQRGTWRYRAVVLCGRRVAAAMGLADLPFWGSDGGTLLVPHPSGLSREWNHLDVAWARGKVSRFLNERGTRCG
jgi:hypothetical protein